MKATGTIPFYRKTCLCQWDMQVHESKEQCETIAERVIP